MTSPKRLYLIDGSSYIYRAFYAVKPLTSKKGIPTNAVYGFAKMILKILKDESPDYIAVVYDSKGETFRHKEFSQYKANRSKMPEDLVCQIPYIKTLVEAFGIKGFHMEAVEADDIIGTLAKAGEKNGLTVTIVSGDKDMMQLIGKNIRMLDTMKGTSIGIEEVKEKYGVPPEKVIEVMALEGDSSDNIPGIPGVGNKTARKLIEQFGTLENLLQHIEDVAQKTLREKIKNNSDLAIISKKLVTIKTNLDLNINFEELERVKPDNDKLINLFKELNFSSLAMDFGIGKSDVSHVASLTLKGEYLLVCEKEKLSELISTIRTEKVLSFKFIFPNSTPLNCNIQGVSISWAEGHGAFIPTETFEDITGKKLEIDFILSKLKPLFESEDIVKYGHNIKNETIILKAHGIELCGEIFDTMIGSYLLTPSTRNPSLHDVVSKYLGFEFEHLDEKASDITSNINEKSFYYCKLTDFSYQAGKIVEDELKKEDLFDLFRDIELPLVRVIALMEINGVKVDEDALKSLSVRLSKEMVRLEKEIYIYAGETFNINSPKQLGEILFDKLKLTSSKKTKTGFSTDVSVLETLTKKHPLPEKILEYRQAMKLQSTYVDALPKLIQPGTGRIHSTYSQTITVTGRLSSFEPNLQNIPVRTKIGNEIRASFIPEKGSLLLSADYSQIELRILAHISKDPVLVDAFLNGRDVHDQTAVEIFGVMEGLVTSEMRRMAKTINFGIIYGMSAHGLSKSLNCSRKEASEFLENYFSRYNGVRNYLQTVVAEARQTGYVTTLFNRRRYLPDLNSSNRQVRENAERMATNTPIQGSAADIIKIAMINIYQRILKKHPEVLMTMQVHDELVFEVPQKQIETITSLIKKEMEEVVKLSVPLIVDIHTGINWNKTQ